MVAKGTHRAGLLKGLEITRNPSLAPAALFLLALLRISFSRYAAPLVDGKFSRFLDSLLRLYWLSLCPNSHKPTRSLWILPPKFTETVVRPGEVVSSVAELAVTRR